MEEKKDGEDSTFNKGEAEVTMAHAKRLVQSGVLPPDIGIITPYAAQKWYTTMVGQCSVEVHGHSRAHDGVMWRWH
ncbi:hypothetical protein JHK87_028227 [Glycine soja]|nr:hypothetical protein JHK87_028227 [Glycine soja]